jgi:hypothetical protein
MISLSCFNVVLLALVSLSSARSAQECTVQMSKAGFTEDFGSAVAHGVHAITVEDLKVFNPLVNETNCVPVVNVDMTSDEPILRSAQSIHILPGGTFKSQGMQMIDRVLSNMDRKDYDFDRSSTLERVAHALHMSDCWQMALIEYHKLVNNNAPKDICPCMLDVDSNGVLTHLRVLALNFREPTLIYGDHIDGHYAINRLNYVYNKVKSNASVMHKSSEALPPLTSTDTWAQWKGQMMSAMDPKDDYALAYFLYCSLN